ncbi:hypothetical protein [Solimonas sp. SE-A11]|uniref:hypothetical protein n=1 Tax=Solimonas sp. SE-A11 TaxID=3054954 RepID=UPI00259CB103|nr:hypothetical protein [Solimonas sp. SE-A11]MDM4771103.1 hypothetical protein [Solimonas sp. SE-A11]
MATTETLENIFGAYVAQDTLEEAASRIVDLILSYPEMKEEFVSILADGIFRASAGDASVAAAVEQSGYHVSGTDEAGQYCVELLELINSALFAQQALQANAAPPRGLI